MKTIGRWHLNYARRRNRCCAGQIVENLGRKSRLQMVQEELLAAQVRPLRIDIAAAWSFLAKCALFKQQSEGFVEDS